MPHRRPESVAELILDLEARAEVGDPEADFEVPAGEWALLVQFAKRELDARRAIEHAAALISATEAG